MSDKPDVLYDDFIDDDDIDDPAAALDTRHRNALREIEARREELELQRILKSDFDYD